MLRRRRCGEVTADLDRAIGIAETVEALTDFVDQISVLSYRSAGVADASSAARGSDENPEVDHVEERRVVGTDTC
jgi:hypothetical protein